jgi:hypothetical protein
MPTKKRKRKKAPLLETSAPKSKYTVVSTVVCWMEYLWDSSSAPTKPKPSRSFCECNTHSVYGSDLKEHGGVELQWGCCGRRRSRERSGASVGNGERSHSDCGGVSQDLDQSFDHSWVVPSSTSYHVIIILS